MSSFYTPGSKKSGWISWPRMAVFFFFLSASFIVLYLLFPPEELVVGLLPDLKNITASGRINDKVLEQCSNCDEAGVTCCNGLSSNCNLAVNDLMYPMLHAANHNEPPDQRHNRQLEDALSAGFRGFEFEVCNCGLGGVEDLVFCSNEDCNLGNRNISLVLNNLVTYLDSNPSEVIILNFNMKTGGPKVKVLWEIMGGVKGFIEKLYTHTVGEDWPTIQTLINDKKQIILFQHNSNCFGDTNTRKCPPALHDYLKSVVETKRIYTSVMGVEDIETSCQINWGASGSKDFYSIIHYLSESDQDSSIRLNQEEFLMTRINQCESITKTPINFFLIDFWQYGDVLEISQRINAARGGCR